MDRAQGDLFRRIPRLAHDILPSFRGYFLHGQVLEESRRASASTTVPSRVFMLLPKVHKSPNEGGIVFRHS